MDRIQRLTDGLTDEDAVQIAELLNAPRPAAIAVAEADAPLAKTRAPAAAEDDRDRRDAG